MSDVENVEEVEVPVEAETETEEVQQEVVRLTPEQVDANHKALEDAIELAIQQYSQAQDEEVFAGMSSVEQSYIKLLDPLVWIMRESLQTYEHLDCEECIERRETDANNLAVDVAEKILGRF